MGEERGSMICNKGRWLELNRCGYMAYAVSYQSALISYFLNVLCNPNGPEPLLLLGEKKNCSSKSNSESH